MRPQDWDKQLYNYVRASQDRPFVWGSWDCCTFVLQWVTLMTGVDHSPKFPAYTTEAEALAVVESMGGWEQMVAEKVGAAVYSNFKMAKRGDVVLAINPPGLGIIIDHRFCRPVQPKGLSFELMRMNARLAWEV